MSEITSTTSSTSSTITELVNTQIYEYGGDIAFAVIDAIILTITFVILLFRLFLLFDGNLTKAQADGFFITCCVTSILLLILLMFSAISYKKSKDNIKPNSNENSINEKEIYRIFTIFNSVFFSLSFFTFLNALLYKFSIF